MEVSKTFGAGSNPAAPANLTAARMAVACVCKWVQGPSAVDIYLYEYQIAMPKP